MSAAWEVFQAGGNMGGDVDQLGHPVMDGLWYVAEGGAIVAGPFNTEEDAAAVRRAIAPHAPADLQRRATRYEVVAVTEDGRRFRLGFTTRVSAAELLRMARNRPDIILPLIRAHETVTTGYSRTHGLAIGPVTVRKSGNTEWALALEAAA